MIPVPKKRFTLMLTREAVMTVCCRVLEVSGCEKKMAFRTVHDPHVAGGLETF